MKEKIRKFLPLVLATLAVFQLVGAWAKLTDDGIFTDLKSPFYSTGDTVYEIQKDIKPRVDSQKIIGEKLGIKFESGKVVGLAQYFYDEKISPEELNYIRGVANPIIKQVVKYYQDELVDFVDDYDFDEDIGFLNVTKTMLNLYHFVYILTWLAFLLFAVSKFVKGKLDFIRPAFPIMMLINVVLFIVTIIIINSSLTDNIDYLETSLTLRPFFALLLALPESLYQPYVDKLLANSSVEAALEGASNVVKKSVDTFAFSDSADTGKTSGAKGWTCPNCSTKNSAGSKFCSSCGKPNPYVMKCPGCGKELKNNEKFCPDCGAPIVWPTIGNVCPQCGTVNSEDSSFCEKCGTKLK